MTVETVRTCVICGADLSGRHKNCTKFCGEACKVAGRSKEWHASYQRQWRLNNLDKSRAAAKRSYNKYLEKNRERGRWNALRWNYGITREQYEVKAESQNWACAICGEGVPRISATRRGLCVDHDHTTGKIRDLLCMACNILIGAAKENVDVLEKASAYLNRWNSLVPGEQLCHVSPL
jgi:hypothetical protein